MTEGFKELTVALAAWEIGRAQSGLGVKIGGLGSVMEELPPELIKAAAKQGIKLELEILTPCFAHYDKGRLTKLKEHFPVSVNETTYDLEGYEHRFPDGQKVVYFWDEAQLNWTSAHAIYPDDSPAALLLYASLCQAMAKYIEQKGFCTIHLHDYHVGLIPFYLGEGFLRTAAVHFTIHNASYQGIIPAGDGGDRLLDQIHLAGGKLFGKYFDFHGNLNLMKACMLRVHESGGKITTVSGDLEATWGYAAELRKSPEEIAQEAAALKGAPPGEVFVPNHRLDLFEKLPIAGITNGMGDRNRPANLPELKAAVLARIQEKRGPDNPLFAHPLVQAEMLARDHNFDVEHLHVKEELKRLLHLEAFGSEPEGDVILLTVVGRLVEQKNFGLVADVAERVMALDDRCRFVILASAPQNDPVGKATEAEFIRLSAAHPDRFYFNNGFNSPLSKLILAGGDFCLIPSRFEPCGLVDYEASLLGTIVIGRATGGLTKVRHCAYLYEWLDMSDREGEALAFFAQIKTAIHNYRLHPAVHRELMRKAMSIDASWETSAAQYVALYRYGLFMKKWQESRRKLIETFLKSLGEERHLFRKFFAPARQEYQDLFDRALKEALDAGEHKIEDA